MPEPLQIALGAAVFVAVVMAVLFTVQTTGVFDFGGGGGDPPVVGCPHNCERGKICIGTECKPGCNPGADPDHCPDMLHCQPDGTCQPDCNLDGCFGADAGKVCNSATGLCEDGPIYPPLDRCANVTCTEQGAYCNPATGVCEGSIIPPTTLCEGVTCPGGGTCIQTTGLCTDPSITTPVSLMDTLYQADGSDCSGGKYTYDSETNNITVLDGCAGVFRNTTTGGEGQCGRASLGEKTCSIGAVPLELVLKDKLDGACVSQAQSEDSTSGKFGQPVTYGLDSSTGQVWVTNCDARFKRQNDITADDLYEYCPKGGIIPNPDGTFQRQTCQFD